MDVKILGDSRVPKETLSLTGYTYVSINSIKLHKIYFKMCHMHGSETHLTFLLELWNSVHFNSQHSLSCKLDDFIFLVERENFFQYGNEIKTSVICHRRKRLFYLYVNFRA